MSNFLIKSVSEIYIKKELHVLCDKCNCKKFARYYNNFSFQIQKRRFLVFVAGRTWMRDFRHSKIKCHKLRSKQKNVKFSNERKNGVHTRKYNDHNQHTCEPSGGSIFLPILRVPSVPPVNFQNLLPVKKIKYNKILTYILQSIFLEIPHLELPR